MHPEKSTTPPESATLSVRSERGTLYRESMTKILLANEDGELEIVEDVGEDPEPWERSDS